MTDSLKATEQIAAQLKEAQDRQRQLNPLYEQAQLANTLRPIAKDVTAAIKEHLAPITAIQDQWS